MRQAIRWLPVGLIFLAVLCAATWIFQVFALPWLIKDEGARWGVAATLGAAVAGFAASGGIWYATRERTPARDSGIENAVILTVRCRRVGPPLVVDTPVPTAVSVERVEPFAYGGALSADFLLDGKAGQ